ncbi:MAG TPA: 7-cyano-7-deazaguanine synthase QueC [Succinivibrionaceae bacterium]|nr:7-cyano-7-deazaguanine synthase QueC [Succinivibrionaceae bacterium]
MNRALVVFSGGQDSCTCLGYALCKYDEVYTVGFSYGQRHRVELDCRKVFLSKLREEFPKWDAKLKNDNLIDISYLKDLTDSALTDETQKSIEQTENNLPSSFVPGRNLIFLANASAYAYTIGADTLITGVGEADYSGYPDCREKTMQAMQQALSLGLERDITIETPLMHLSKARTWELAEQAGGSRLVDLIVKESHTCYLGDRSIFHPWGFGCGQCPACILRQKGYEEYMLSRSRR